MIGQALDLSKVIVAAADRGWRFIPLRKAEKTPLLGGWRDVATSNLDQLAAWAQQYPGCNWGIATGTSSNLVAIDVDGSEGRQSLAELEARGFVFPATLTVSTGREEGGQHLLYELPDGVEIRNSGGKLGSNIDVRGSGGYIVAPPSIHPSGRPYFYENPEERVSVLPGWLAAKLASRGAVDPPTPELDRPKIEHPHRTFHLMSLILRMLKRSDSLEAAIGAALAENAAYCVPPKTEKQVRDLAVDLYKRYGAEKKQVAATPVTGKPTVAPQWPQPMAHAAFHGLAGDFVRLVMPETEADPQAILIAFLVIFGCMVGRHPFYQVEATQHFCNLSAVIVGKTAKARKGTAVDRALAILDQVDPEFAATRQLSGLSSGEGLIQAVRDAREEDVKDEDSHGQQSFERRVVDPGVSDKRLLALETEFGSVLQQSSRAGNTLSQILRKAWDGKRLGSLARSNKDSCEKPHVSVLGNITVKELRKLLTDNDSANGFGNRFLWCCAKRSKMLPHGGRDLDPLKVESLVTSLRAALKASKNLGRMDWDPEAYEAWCRVYRVLSEDSDGIYGALTARSEAQVVRLATLFAVLDMSPVIRLVHLEAAQEVWTYCDESVACIFGSALGDDTADSILKMLHSAPEGLTQTEISKIFSGHKKASELNRALALLKETQKIVSEKVPTGGGPATRWYLAADSAE